MASERNSAVFVIERSARGEAYEAVREASAQGNSTAVTVYAAAANRLTPDLTATAEPCAVRVLSLAGQVLRAETLAGGRVQEMPLAGLPAGLYVLQVRTAQGSTVQRIGKR